MRRHRSRLIRREERRSKKSLVFAIAGTIILIFLIFKVGIPALAQFSLFLSNLTQPQEAKSTELNFLQPPVLDPLPTATNSATIRLTGIATTDREIEILINGDFVSKTETTQDGKFEVQSLKLRNGENIITARIKDDDAKSEPSNEVVIIYDDTSPALEILSPTDNASFSKFDSKIEVRGKTEADARATVNDSRVVVDSQGNFSYLLGLQDGQNKITVRAVDNAGNQTEVQRTVTYSP